MTTLPVSLEVTFAAYLAVLLGTFLPVTFLIVLYSQVSPSLLSYQFMHCIYSSRTFSPFLDEIRVKLVRQVLEVKSKRLPPHLYQHAIFRKFCIKILLLLSTKPSQNQIR